AEEYNEPANHEPLERRADNKQEFLEVPLDEFDANHLAVTRDDFARDRQLMDPTTLRVNISPQPYCDHTGKPLTASFNHDDIGGEVVLNREIKITGHVLELGSDADAD